MTLLPPEDDQQWQEFLRKNCPTPPPIGPDLEEKLMKAVQHSPHPVLNRRLWAVPPVIAAGLLMAWSSYRTLIPVPNPSQTASLEAFLENNWSSVVGETPPRTQSNSAEASWMLLANTTP